MTAVDKGKFCSNCQKSVIDFTSWSDKDLYQYIDKNRGQGICGRIKASQLNREIRYPDQKPTKFYRIAVGLGLVLLFSQVPDSNARSYTPFVVENSFYTDQVGDIVEVAAKDSIIISGQVFDEQKEPIIGAVVQISQNGSPIVYDFSDIDGKFRIIIPARFENSRLTLMAHYITYKDVSQVIDMKNLREFYKFTMEPADEIIRMGMMPVDYRVPLINRANPGSNTTFSSDQLENMR